MLKTDQVAIAFVQWDRQESRHVIKNNMTTTDGIIKIDLKAMRNALS